MSISINIAATAAETLASLFPRDELGRISFGFAGYTIDPRSPEVLAHSSIRIRDHMMERSVAYSLRLIFAESGTTIVIEDVTDGRDKEVEWFVREYIKSKGIEVIAAPDS